MWALIALLFSALVSSTSCPKATPGNPSNQVIKLGYRYDFSYDKNLAMDSVQIQVASGTVLDGKWLWFHIDPTSTTANSANMFPRVKVNQMASDVNDGMKFMPNSDADGSLLTGSIYLALNLSMITPNFTMNSANTIWITFFAGGTCEACIHTIDFALEAALTTAEPSPDYNEPTNFDVIPLVEDVRSFQWQAPSTGSNITFVVSYPPATSAYKLYSSVTTEGTGQVVLYWNKDTPANVATPANATQIYPDPATSVQGNYQVQTPFTADAAGGTYYLTVYMKRPAISGLATTNTIKSKTGSYPCDSAATTSVSAIALLLMAVLSYLNL